MGKVLVFSDYYKPGYKAGGPIKSILNLVQLIENDLDTFIITRNFDIDGIEYPDTKTDSLLSFEQGHIVYLNKISFKNIFKWISSIEPDAIYLNSAFSKFSIIVLMLAKSKLISAKIILAPRGEFQLNALNIKKHKKAVFLSFYKALNMYKGVIFHATDEIEKECIKNITPFNEIKTLMNASFLPNNLSVLEKKENSLRLVFLSRILPNKNLLMALNALNLTNVTVTFDIYGPIEDEEYWGGCLNVIKKLPNNICCNYYGGIKPHEVPNVLSKYHSLFLPTETENFGHVIVEAMSLGLVPIISDQTPWRNLEGKRCGWDLSLDESQLFVSAVEFLYSMNNKLYQEYRQNSYNYIKQRLNLSGLKSQYIELFNL